MSTKTPKKPSRPKKPSSPKKPSVLTKLKKLIFG